MPDVGCLGDTPPDASDSVSDLNMRLSELAVTEIGRLLNGKEHPHDAAIGHLSIAAARSAESLSYLADLDDQRFGGIWPADGYHNDTVDDAHVRWAATGALTSLDLCIAAAAKLGGFFVGSHHREVSIRDYYSVGHSGKVDDKRHLVSSPWRAWLDALIADPRYKQLLRVRHALVHADALRIIHGTTGTLTGHALRFGYNVGPLTPPVQPNSHMKVMAREVIQLSRDVAQVHVGAFIVTLQSIP
jgi:hypothetical protein